MKYIIGVIDSMKYTHTKYNINHYYDFDITEYITCNVKYA